LINNYIFTSVICRGSLKFNVAKRIFHYLSLHAFLECYLNAIFYKKKAKIEKSY